MPSRSGATTSRAPEGRRRWTFLRNVVAQKLSDPAPAAHALERRRPRRFLCDERGQALSEYALLLALLFGASVAGGAWLLARHGQMLHALDIAVGSYSFVLSLPLP